MIKCWWHYCSSYISQTLTCLNSTHAEYTYKLTLADITSSDGTFIKPLAKQGQSLQYRTNNLNWPIQQQPPNTSSRLYLETNDKLKTPSATGMPMEAT